MWTLQEDEAYLRKRYVLSTNSYWIVIKSGTVAQTFNDLESDVSMVLFSLDRMLTRGNATSANLRT